MSKADSKKTKGADKPTIALNRRAKFDYFIEERFEAGLSLLGWEVKSLREDRGRIAEAYVTLKNGEALLLGAHFDPPKAISTHVLPDPKRTRKLLLNRRELNRLIGATEREGYTVIPTALYWKNGLAKLEIGVAKGKKLHDKRETIKDREWNRSKERLMRN